MDILCPLQFVEWVHISTHCGRVTHINASVTCAIIVFDNGLTPVRYKAIIWTNVDLLSIEPLRENLSKIWIKMQKNQESLEKYGGRKSV